MLKGDDDEPPSDNDEPPQDTPSPLVLDLNNNDITSTWLYDNQVYFDLDGDGFRERTGWIESGDGLLALDMDGSGTIDNGTELFGNYSANESGTNADHGFMALSRYDNNKDDVIDKNDSIYGSLVVWIDTNSDGISQSGELHSLLSLGIVSINLNAQAVDEWENFNTISHSSTFTRATEDGGSEDLAIRDVWFEIDSKDTRYDFNGTINDQVAALPSMAGSGRVISLTHAMANDTELQSKVTALLNNSSATLPKLLNMVDAILARWADVEDIDPKKTRGDHWLLNHDYNNPQKARVYRSYAYAREIAILERFSGQLFQMNVDGELNDEVNGTLMAQRKKVEYQTLRIQVALTLLSQSLFGTEVYDESTGSLNWETIYTGLPGKLSAGADQTAAISLLAVLVERNRLSLFNHLDSALLADPVIHAGLQASGILLNVDENGQISGRIDDAYYSPQSGGALNGTVDDDVLFGSDGDDILIGGDGDDILDGGDGNDILYAGSHAKSDRYGYDILIGDRGDDTLYGTYRASTYIYSYGEGHDIIHDPGMVANAMDTLELRGILREDVQVERVDKDMLLSIRNLVNWDGSTPINGSILITNGFGYGKMERFEFAGDITMTYEELLQSAGFLNDVYEQPADQAVFLIDDPDGKEDCLVFAEGNRQNLSPHAQPAAGFF